MSISDRLDEIEARADAATDGPWESDRHVRGDGHVVIGGGLRRAHLPGDVPGHAENTEFIAASRADVPRLVAALRAVLDVHVQGVAYGVPVCMTCAQVKDADEWDDPDDDPIPSWMLYPCPTVRAVQAALGEEASDE